MWMRELLPASEMQTAVTHNANAVPAFARLSVSAL